MRRRWLMRLAALLLPLGLSLAADRALGLLHAWYPSGVHAPLKDGLIFPPSAQLQYHTPEFTFTAATNALGFRGPAFPEPENTDDARVIVLGDSFTFGWGVEYEQSWCYLVEERLRAQGLPAALANLGMPGGSPKQYAANTARAIPRLRPDVVVVVCTQGEDVGQLLQQQSEPPQDERQAAGIPLPSDSAKHDWRMELAQSAAERLYPNTLRFIQTSGVRGTRNAQRRRARKYRANMTFEELQRFERLEPTVKDMFLSGDLSPHLVYGAIRTPDAYIRQLQDTPEKAQALAALAGYFTDIRTLADNAGAHMVVVTIPHGHYVSAEALAHTTRIGLRVSEDMLTTTIPDADIAEAAAAAGVPCASVTAALRARDSRGWYYPLDGHMTAAGNAAYADAITPVFIEALRRAADQS